MLWVHCVYLLDQHLSHQANELHNQLYTIGFFFLQIQVIADALSYRYFYDPLIDIDISQRLPIDIDIFHNCLIDIDIDIFQNCLIDIDIFTNDFFLQKCRYVDNQYSILIYRTGLGEGHFARECPFERPKYFCYHCGGEGHFARDCVQ